MQGNNDIRPAATTILAREGAGVEVLMVKRHHEVDFVAGAMVFPGGKVDRSDADEAWSGHATGWDDVAAGERPLRIAAIRECFEECGVILGDPGKVKGGEATRIARAAIDRRQMRFLDYVREMDVTLDLSRLVLFARWLTPAVVPKRFDTFFYLAKAPEGQETVSDGRETVKAEWIAPDRALRLAASGDRTIVFPTRMNLKLLSQGGSIGEIMDAAARRSIRVVEPRIVSREGTRFLQIDEDSGYGAVEEPLEIV